MTEWPKVARTTDPVTSHQAAGAIEDARPSQAMRLLRTYVYASQTDEEAAREAGLLHTGYWKRCADLRNLGLIEPQGATRQASSGMQQQVCTITKAGSVAVRIGRLPPVASKPRQGVTRDRIAAEVHAWMDSPNEHEHHLIERMYRLINGGTA